MLSECIWPSLPPRYDAALREAVAFIFETFDPVGIVATGTIVRGNPGASSDLDLYVIIAGAFRRRVQRFFAGVPAEIFVNPPRQVRAYFRDEHAEGEPLTAHMLATGVVVWSSDAVIGELCSEARDWLSRASTPSESHVIRAKYAAATRFEDALDVAPSDEATATMLLTLSITAMLELWCRIHHGRIPRRKDLIATVAEHDATLGTLVRDFFLSATFASRQAIATALADRTIGVHEFFEWDSGPEMIAGGDAGRAP